MRNFVLVSAAALMLSAAPAMANPMALAGAGAAAQAASEAASQSDQTSTNKTGDTTVVSGALGQAQTALSQSGPCGKGNRFLFGLLEWTDYSSKCFNYHMAIEAEHVGNHERANMWVKRADGIE